MNELLIKNETDDKSSKFILKIPIYNHLMESLTSTISGWPTEVLKYAEETGFLLFCGRVL